MNTINHGGKMELNKNKFKNLLHYIISKSGFLVVGKTLLHRLLYFSDFNYFEIYEKSLTNETYKRLPHGPLPVHFELAIFELEKEGKINADSRSGGDMSQFRYVSLKEPENDFTEEELNVVDEVIEKLSKMDAAQINEYSRGDMPWRAAEDYEIMKYSFVFYRDPKYRVREYDSN